MFYIRIILITICGLLTPFDALAEIFKGQVVDESGSPLIGAVIKSVKENKTMFTDVNGNFTIVSSGNTVKFQISYTGFITETFILKAERKPRVHKLRLTSDTGALQEVVITATRTPKNLKDVPVVTRLISEEDLRKADATNIQDLLTDELPGLEFSYAMSQETSLNMSGFGGKAVLFLVDGERLAGETLENVDFNRLNLGNVGRVEIVKGAASALYGANAVGGVVNLITRENTEPWHVNVNSRYRSLGNEWRHGADISLHSGKWTSNTDAQYTTAQTVRLTDAFDTESSIHNIFGGNSLNLKERISYQASDKLRLTARGGYFNRISTRINYDDHYMDYNGGLRGVWNITSRQTLELSYSYDQYDKNRYVNAERTHDHDYSNRQHIAHALYTHCFGKNILTAGADYMHDYLLTYQFVDDEPHSQSSADAFVQFDYNPLSWLNLVASVRDDYFSESKNNALTARLASMFKFNGFSVRASYAGGFRAPTLKEMYMNFDMAGIQMIYGNPGLKPERSHNFSISLEHSGRTSDVHWGGSYNLTATGHYNMYDSRITTTDFPGDEYREEGAIYCNENGVRVSCVDFSARYRTVMGLGFLFNYNYLHTSGNTIDSQFSQPRPHSMTWRLDYEKRLCSVYKLYAGISGRYLAKPVSRYETDAAYSLWKFTLQQEVWHGININFVIDNLLDYRPKVYYWNSTPTTGRNWSVGISMDIDSMFK
ncbi:MAG: TonB-dependent receptor [Bacteroidaceae bacterium]|nr:TonB-dependent receptor [Bacteroidaceae bacterium]